MEKYTQLFLNNKGPLIQPKESYEYEFDFETEKDREYRLFFTGETDIFYYWKTEYMSTPLYRRIGDALVRGKCSAFGLQFKGKDYQLLAAHKVTFPIKLAYLGYKNPTEKWQFGITASAKNIKINDGGYLHIMLEVRDKKEGMINRQATHKPDREIVIDIPEGTYDLKHISEEIYLSNSDTANVYYIVEGENFEGEVILEEPELISADDYNVIPPFSFDSSMYVREFNWLGVNLSRHEWPEMKIELNGEVVFNDEFFERCHRYSEKEIVLPKNALQNGKNKLKFTIMSDYHDCLPYRLHELGIVSEDDAEFNIVAYPEIAQVGEPIALLLHLNEDCDFEIKSKAMVLSETRLKKGLQVIKFLINEPSTDMLIEISTKTHTEKCSVRRVVKRVEDNVITGSGDMIYVNQDYTDSINYFKWYTQNNIGKLMTIRPVYRWSGTRRLNMDMWATINRLTKELGMHISHMIDGREPQGMLCNPRLKDMEGPQFLGRQEHERDGAYAYWGSMESPADFWDINGNGDTEMIFDNIIRQERLHPEIAGAYWRESDIFCDGKRLWIAHDHTLPMDAEVITKANIRSIINSKRDCTRHTGPSILFKYFIQAGFDWVGAETMDSPTEFLMSGLRGAKRAYGIKSTGVHHALQWSTHPHDDPMHYRRYRLALYVTYLHGVTEINTEEGLWHMEEYYASHNRFSVASREHLKMQQDFNKFVQSHSRRGEFHAPIGVIHGRYDGTPCFGSTCGPFWGQQSKNFTREFDSDASWYIPALSFYPNMVTNFVSCAHNAKTGPIGLVSGTPRGSFDIVPIEEKIGDYKLLAFFGYNKAEKEDIKHILDAVKQGATALLTLAHLSDTTLRKDTESYNLHFSQNGIMDIIGVSEPTFITDKVDGNELPIANNIKTGKILEKTAFGLPFILEYEVGKGKIILFNTKYYPANKAIKDKYTEVFNSLCDKVNAEEYVFPLVDNKVEAVVYNCEGGQKDIYFIAVDWWNEPSEYRPCVLSVGNFKYDMSLPFGVCKKVVVNGDRLAWCDDEETDILSLDDKIIVQGYGKSHINIAENGKTARIDIDFTHSPYQEIEWSL